MAPTSDAKPVTVTLVDVSWKPVLAVAVVPFRLTEALSVSAPTVVVAEGDTVITACPAALVSAVFALNFPRLRVLANVTT